MSQEGICKIKAEYILSEQNREINLDCVSDKDKKKLGISNTDTQSNEDGTPQFKKQKNVKKRYEKVKRAE
ncbi:hypothetical protein NQ314_000501 [Rhamnusium bicolor]|uniref:Uncharacterized protein n=1 Tax=Rhamnusium bicolor TaxID=1586634 RepID=A0AAV8ZV09_9CUCU|nr:hypothetical protein NQ314_000501 [Rhamnusium bicolor]